MSDHTAVEIPVTSCRPSPTARPVQGIKVEALARSIKDVGLRQPINVRPVDGGYEVRGGGHRVAAFQRLGRETIPAFVRDDDDLHAELAEIDENLVRNEMSTIERDLAISRRKVIYEQLHPETVHGAIGRGRTNRVAIDGDSIEPPVERFTKATSNDIGMAERTIQRSVSRVEDIGGAALGRIVGSSLDRGDELDALAKLPAEHRNRLIDRAAAGEDVSAKRGDGALPNGARAIMGSRQEPDDSLDYFPTPPWATRALMEHVMPAAGVAEKRFGIAWEPACGEGHIAEVLAEYSDLTIATDIFDYGYGQAPVDFLGDLPPNMAVDWIVTNPPFDEKAEAFVLRALEVARDGVAMFFRLQWIPTVGRYNRIFGPTPPTLVAFFSERVPLVKGRWDPDASTATDYVWLVWRKGEKPRAPFWIPPGQREALTRPDDRERFTTKPVTKRRSEERRDVA